MSAAIVVDFGVGLLLTLPALNVQAKTVEQYLGSWTDNVLELSTLCLGLVAALLLVALPPLVVIIVPSLLLLERGVLIKDLEVAATTDQKTGALNVNTWRTVAERDMARASRAASPSLGIVMIDLDHFKRINDSYGHLVGDDVLKRVAETIAEQVREYDTVGRFGGEEFVVVLPDTSHHDTNTVCERIRCAVRALEITVTRQAAPQLIKGLTVSVGYAMMPGAGTTVDELLDGADAALYRAKRSGRDRVVHVADPIAPPAQRAATLDTVDDELLPQPVPETAT